MTSTIRSAMRKRDRFLRKFRLTKSLTDWNKYKSQRNLTVGIDTSRICLSEHKTIEAGNENRLFTMDYIARLDFKLLFCVHSSKFGKCQLYEKRSFCILTN